MFANEAKVFLIWLIWMQHSLGEQEEFVKIISSISDNPLKVDQNITHLEINGLDGILRSDWLSQLSNVTHLRIFSNDLTKIEPGAICTVPNLKKLELYVSRHYQESGVDQDVFKNCDKLEQLDLSGDYYHPTKLKEEAFSKMANLKFLSLSSMNVSHLTRNYFNDLKSLTNLTMFKCGVREIDPDTFEGAQNLERIEIIHDKEFSHLPKNLFGKLKKLDSLRLFGNNITGLTWDEFEGLTNLRELSLGMNEIDTFHVDQVVKHMPNLQEFSIEHNRLDCVEKEIAVKRLKEGMKHPVNVMYKFNMPFVDSCEEIDE